MPPRKRKCDEAGQGPEATVPATTNTTTRVTRSAALRVSSSKAKEASHNKGGVTGEDSRMLSSHNLRVLRIESCSLPLFLGMPFVAAGRVMGGWATECMLACLVIASAGVLTGASNANVQLGKPAVPLLTHINSTFNAHQ